MPAYWIYVIGLRKWWNFYDTLMWPLMGNYVKCVNIAFASTLSTCFNNFKEAKSNNVAICFAFTDVLRVETKVAEWSKASRYPEWCWIRYFWSPAMLYQRCWCKCSVAVVYRAGQPSRIVLPDSLWQPLNSFIATCIQLRLIFWSSATVSVLLCLAFATYRVFFTVTALKIR